MENIIEKVNLFADTADKSENKVAPVRKIRSASVNLIRQFPERPGEWGNRIVVVVCAGSANSN